MSGCVLSAQPGQNSSGRKAHPCRGIAFLPNPGSAGSRDMDFLASWQRRLVSFKNKHHGDDAKGCAAAAASRCSQICVFPSEMILSLACVSLVSTGSCAGPWRRASPGDCAYIAWGHAVVPLSVLGSREKEFPCNFQSVNHPDAVFLLTSERVTFIPCFISLLQSKLMIKCLALRS